MATSTPRARRAWSVLRGEIAEILLEPDEANSLWSASLKLILANIVLDRMSAELMETREGWLTEEHDWPIVAGQREYEIPDGGGILKRVLMIRAPGGANGQTTETPLQRSENWADSVTTPAPSTLSHVGANPTYRVQGSNVLLEPPHSDTNATLRAELEVEKARLTGDGSTIPREFPTGLAEANLIWQVVKLCIGIEQAQGNADPSSRDYLKEEIDRADRRWRDLIETRSQGKVRSTPWNLGD